MGSGAHTTQEDLSRPRPSLWSQGKQKCLGEAWPTASFADKGSTYSQDRGPSHFCLRPAHQAHTPTPGGSSPPRGTQRTHLPDPPQVDVCPL